MYNQLSCGVNVGNTGMQDCTENFGRIQKLLIVPSDFEIDTQANALLEATYVTAINAAKSDRMYPLFTHFNAEIDQEERVQEEGWGGQTDTVREGKDRATFIFEDIPIYLHKELRKHNNTKKRAFYAITSQGYILGYSLDGVKFLPQTIGDFYVQKRNWSDGSNKSRTSIRIEVADVTQWNDNGVWVQPTAFDPLLLDGIKDVVLTGTLTATGVTSLLVAGAADSVGVDGLVAANFNLYADSAPSTPIAVTVAADNGDGTYDLTWADQTGTGAVSLELFDQPAGTNFFESINVVQATL